ncbi:flavin monoamine oxidase family protein [Mesorhizobium sp. L-8-3]|uniref:flavin monoamine oxidase family protein n=1 Tax=Mesorhizobium sp. L-8-3 TaxID=2744522 RepID=UPI00192780BD|nr:NAD(P)/FAD-dependent oxidoreductase [Mesorhizobium sp. L-8-3]BCH22200.1 amine oxidase [Mesorhizobium sp. L-8-3]
MVEVDVVIVGAGSSGLSAAKTLRSAGRSFLLFEATNRIGGRAWTSSEHFGIPFDIGCAWLHAADRNPYFEEAKSAGWTLQYHDMNLDHLYFGRKKASEQDEVETKLADAQLTALLETHVGHEDRLSALLADGQASRAAATFAGPMDFGKDYDEISIADFKAAADLEPNYLSKEGFGALVAHYGADVAVEFATPVRRIRWDGPEVVCETDRGAVRASAAIVTASPAVLAFEEIAFVPDLPDAHRDAIFDLPMGMLTKLPIEIKGNRLGLKPFEDLLIERRAEHDIYFLCFPFDLDLMIGFVGGDFAWELSAAGQEAGVDFVTNRLCGIFGNDLRKQVGRAMMTNWGGERWVRGAYAAARPGQAGARKVLAEPVAERIWFAGEHLAGPLIQTCGGARLSGEAVALQVIARLASR